VSSNGSALVDGATWQHFRSCDLSSEVSSLLQRGCVRAAMIVCRRHGATAIASGAQAPPSGGDRRGEEGLKGWSRTGVTGGAILRGLRLLPLTTRCAVYGRWVQEEVMPLLDASQVRNNLLTPL
jgi:hypothetical protein